MSTLTGVSSLNPAEAIQRLKDQAVTAYAQQRTAEKAVVTFAEFQKDNLTPENARELQNLVTISKQANEHATQLCKKVLDAELAYYNPKNTPVERAAYDASFESRQIEELDLESPPGYFPT